MLRKVNFLNIMGNPSQMDYLCKYDLYFGIFHGEADPGLSFDPIFKFPTFTCK